MNPVLFIQALLLAAAVFIRNGSFFVPVVLVAQIARAYVLPRPKKMILDKKVNEISGLFYLQNENAMIAIADNKQKIYRVTQDGKVNNYLEDDFGPSADFEDVVMVDSTCMCWFPRTIADRSKTNRFRRADRHVPLLVQAKTILKPLYYDTSSKGLIMLCKNCEADRGENIRTALPF
jgi:hypothetical protein